MMASSKSKQRQRSSPSSKKTGGGRKESAAAATCGGTTTQRRKSTNSFPYKLYQLLEDVSSGRKVCAVSRRKLPPGSSNLAPPIATTTALPCVAWSDDFEGSFNVYDSDVFMEEVACDYFKMTKYRSFTRQLNIWGYRRIVRRGYDEWHHPALVRSDPSSCDLISRTNATDTIDQKPPTVDVVSVKRKKRTKPVYPPSGSSGTYAFPSAVESRPGGPPPAWDASGGMSSGMAPVFLSHTEMSGGFGSGGYDPYVFASLETQQQARSTAGRFKSTDAACGPSPAHSARRPPSRHAVVNDPIDPFDVMSIEAPAFDPDLYDEQLLGLAEARSREEPEDGG